MDLHRTGKNLRKVAEVRVWVDSIEISSLMGLWGGVSLDEVERHAIGNDQRSMVSLTTKPPGKKVRHRGNEGNEGSRSDSGALLAKASG